MSATRRLPSPRVPTDTYYLLRITSGVCISIDSGPGPRNNMIRRARVLNAGGDGFEPDADSLFLLQVASSGLRVIEIEAQEIE